MVAIETTGLTKRYGNVVALRDFDLRVHEGEIYGFLGPNGAGKSTTINLLLDFIRPTSGSVQVFGHDAQEESIAIRQRTSVLPEGFDLYDRLTARQHLQFVNESKNTSADPERITERVGILRGGTLVAEDTVEGLRDAAESEAVLTIDVDSVPEGTLSAVRGLSGVSKADATDTTVTAHCQDNAKMTVLTELEATGASVKDFSLEEASLEELFMAYTSDDPTHDAARNPARDIPEQEVRT